MTTPKVSSNTFWLSLGFLLIFFGFEGVQQYVTLLFRTAHMPHAGFVSLILIYAAFMVGNLFSPFMVTQIGSRKSLLIVYAAYALYCLTLPTKLLLVIYPVSIVLGVAAGVLWTAQNSYLVRVSHHTQYGKNAGFFAMTFAIGAGSGVFLMGLLIPNIGATMAFLLFGSIVSLAGLCFMRLDDVRGEVLHTGNMTKMLRSPTAVRYSMFWLAFNFIQGLVLGIVPLKISDVIGVSAIGPLIGLFYISPIVFSYVVGKVSDTTGRREWSLAVLLLSLLGLLLVMGGSNPWFLGAGIVVLALNFGISRTVTIALVGDVTDKKNTEHFAALVWTVQAASTLLALLLSTVLLGRSLYLVSLAIVSASILIVWPVLSVPLKEIRRRISEEVA